MDVREHTIAAALEDPRFPPVQPKELSQIEVEVSRLTVHSDSNIGMQMICLRS